MQQLLTPISALAEESVQNKTEIDMLITSLREKYRFVIVKTNMHEVGEDLRDIVESDGLGVALLVAWLHGLEIGHIPLTKDPATDKPANKQVEKEAEPFDCPYVFVHVPVREFRRDHGELVNRKIMNRKADPVGFIYHEDGLIGTFSFPDAEDLGLSKDDVARILNSLDQWGLLIKANIENRQIQFKNVDAKKVIKDSSEPIYVRSGKPFALSEGMLRAPFDSAKVRDYFSKIITGKFECNYCSVLELNPHEATIHSASLQPSSGPGKDVLSTIRNYQFGFTFAPFGDPREVCHFLAWDFPHINDLVENMSPQVYSFSDLIKLVRLINLDIAKLGSSTEAPKMVLSGVCNHWAGNSIYHQHYQFFNIPEVPLVHALPRNILATYKEVQVKKFDWPAPAYLITSSHKNDDKDVMFVADRIASEWESLNSGFYTKYGNGIVIKNHTQNIFATVKEDILQAIFIPRLRSRLDTNPENGIQKKSAAVLEMMGYFVLDEPKDFTAIQNMTAGERTALGKRWLSELSPDAESIQKFEDQLGIILEEPVVSYERTLARTLLKQIEEAEKEIFSLLNDVYRTTAGKTREYLDRTIRTRWMQRYGKPL